VALVGLSQAWGEDFCRAVFRTEFGEGRNIAEPATIHAVLTSFGQDGAAVLKAAQSDAVKGVLRSQTEEAQKLGIFGAPSFITSDGELFWGNDRLEQALAWAKR
jgi:2-hydroxychromene-2-carboxylate isomerase